MEGESGASRSSLTAVAWDATVPRWRVVRSTIQARSRSQGHVPWRAIHYSRPHLSVPQQGTSIPGVAGRSEECRVGTSYSPSGECAIMARKWSPTSSGAAGAESDF